MAKQTNISVLKRSWFDSKPKQKQQSQEDTRKKERERERTIHVPSQHSKTRMICYSLNNWRMWLNRFHLALLVACVFVFFGMDFQSASKLHNIFMRLTCACAPEHSQMPSNQNWFNLNKKCKFFCGFQSKTIGRMHENRGSLWSKQCNDYFIVIFLCTSTQLVGCFDAMSDFGKALTKISSRNVHIFSFHSISFRFVEFHHFLNNVRLFTWNFSPSSKANK